ncbi:TRAP transporter large permease [Defluviitalea phaphyphila]|uniref:TRAP transporter large permease n=1 Tax=Defluviitalea phaphyphila TaxID=1473580 RepID=UPI000A4A1C77|nr:TRAP transporter large permease [Defluviitalea phaphyphila]
MGSETIGVIMLFGILALLMFIRIPIAFSLGISSLITALFLKIDLFLLFQKMVTSLYNFGFLAVPFFIISAAIMTEGGISDKLMKFANVLVGRIRGGTAMVNIVVSMLFGGISGSSVADVSSIGALLIPAMEKEGYDKDYSVAVTVTSSIQGIIIPPSQNMIYYAIAAGGLSISELFMAGYIPGVLLGIVLMIVAYFVAVKRNYPVGDRYSMGEAIRATVDSILGLITIVIIIGGIVGGVFTPTESAGIAAIYGLIITTFVYRTMTFKKLKKVFVSSLSSLATIMAVISMSSMFGYILAYLKVPAMISEGMLSITDNPILIMLMINIILLIAGMFMDMSVLIFMLTPILLPVATQIGYSPIHFGVIMILNLGIGLCTPPVGNSLFVGCAIAKLPIEKSIKAFLPFYLAILLLLTIIIAFPQLCLWLPSKIL